MNYRKFMTVDPSAMDDESTRAVFDAIRSGDEQLKQQLIESATAAASEMIGECVSSEVSFHELFLQAGPAVREAVRDFDPAAGQSFMQYLGERIEQCVKQCYSVLPGLLSIDYRTVQLHDRYIEALWDLYPECADAEDDAVQDEECVAQYLGVSLGALRDMKNQYSMSTVVSLSTPVVLSDLRPDDDIDGTVTLMETIPDPATDNPAADYLDLLMEGLTDDERYVVCARNGVLSVMERPDSKIARDLGLGIDRLEVIYQRALRKIRKAKTGNL